MLKQSIEDLKSRTRKWSRKSFRLKGGCWDTISYVKIKNNHLAGIDGGLSHNKTLCHCRKRRTQGKHSQISVLFALLFAHCHNTVFGMWHPPALKNLLNILSNKVVRCCQRPTFVCTAHCLCTSTSPNPAPTPFYQGERLCTVQPSTLRRSPFDRYDPQDQNNTHTHLHDRMTSSHEVLNFGNKLSPGNYMVGMMMVPQAPTLLSHTALSLHTMGLSSNFT